MYEIIDCPHCGYDNARYHLSYSILEEFTSCPRCGYYCLRTGKIEENETVWGSEKEGGGIGSFALQGKEDDYFDFETVDEHLMAQVKSDLSKYQYCKYTFKKQGQWYVFDLLTNTVECFCDWDFWYDEDDMDDVQE